MRSVLKSPDSHVHVQFSPERLRVVRKTPKLHTYTQAQYQFPLSKCWESEGPQQKATDGGGRDRGRERERLTPLNWLVDSPFLTHTNTHTYTQLVCRITDFLCFLSSAKRRKGERRETREYVYVFIVMDVCIVCVCVCVCVCVYFEVGGNGWLKSRGSQPGRKRQ